jgi:hypothetical protein
LSKILSFEVRIFTLAQRQGGLNLGGNENSKHTKNKYTMVEIHKQQVLERQQTITKVKM